MLPHWKTELWGAWGVLPTWRELALWLHSSLSASGGDSRYIFTEKPLSLPSCLCACSHPSPMTCNKNHRASLSGTGAVFSPMEEMALYTKHNTNCVPETYLLVQEPHEATKVFVLVSSPCEPQTHKWGPQRKVVSGERGGPTKNPYDLNVVIWYKDGGTGACLKMVQKAGKRRRSVLKRTERKEHENGRDLGFAKAWRRPLPFSLLGLSESYNSWGTYRKADRTTD